MDADANAAYIVDDVPRVGAPEVKNVFPHAPMRMDVKETLAEGNKNGDMEERIQGQLMQLNPVDKQETTKELMDRSGKTVNEKVNECYPESDRGMWEAFIAGKLQGFLLLQQAKLLQHLLVLVGDLGPLPSRNLSLLHRGIGTRGFVP
jgi:hypothetical protein